MNSHGYHVRPSKHFVATWMKKWDYDTHTLREAIEHAYRTDKVGKNKYEVYVRAKGKSRKFILIKNEEYRELFIITGAEGT